MHIVTACARCGVRATHSLQAAGQRISSEYKLTYEVMLSAYSIMPINNATHWPNNNSM